MIPLNYSAKSSRKGQVLIVIVFLMLLSLVVGVTVSSRLISTLHNFTGTDNTVKAAAAADSGVERFLAVPEATLKTYIQNASCGSNCYWEVTAPNGQKISTTVTLAYLGNSSDPYYADLKNGDTLEINLAGLDTNKKLDLCWDTSASIYTAYIFTQGSSQELTAYAYNASNSTYGANGFSVATGLHGHQSCFSVTTANTPNLLRIKAFYVDAPIYIIPQAGVLLPLQGIEITSVGRAGDAVRTVKVLRKAPRTSSIFDYVLYQKSTSDPLSNRPD